MEASYSATVYPGDDPITEPLGYSSGNVQFILIPREDMKWWAWSTALWGIRLTMRDHEMFFGWDFKVISREFGEIGYGTLGEIRRSSPERVRHEKELF